MIVFGFMGRIPSRVELIQWIKSPQVLGFGNSVEQISYLDKGFVSVRLSNENDVKKLLCKGPLFFIQAVVCVILWEPIFDSAALLKEVHPIWVELVRLPCWLWDSLQVLASKVETPLYIPSQYTPFLIVNQRSLRLGI